MQIASHAISRKTRILHAVARFGAPLSAPLAGSGWIGIWGTLEHVGRRSGRRYRIPVAVIRTEDGFLIPKPFGAATQWSQNVIAAGGATVRWHGRDVSTTQPTIDDWEAARPSFNRVLRAIVPILGIREFVRLRDTEPVLDEEPPAHS